MTKRFCDLCGKELLSTDKGYNTGQGTSAADFTIVARPGGEVLLEGIIDTHQACRESVIAKIKNAIPAYLMQVKQGK